MKNKLILSWCWSPWKVPHSICKKCC